MVWNAGGQADLVPDIESAHSLLLKLQHALDPRTGENALLGRVGDLRQTDMDTNKTTAEKLTQPIKAQAHLGTTNGTAPTLDGILRKAPRKFQGKPADSATTRPTPHPTPTDLVRGKFGSCPSPLLWDWKTIAYTDGSLIKTKIEDGRTVTFTGAGLYIPSREGTGKTCRLTRRRWAHEYYQPSRTSGHMGRP